MYSAYLKVQNQTNTPRTNKLLQNYNVANLDFQKHAPKDQRFNPRNRYSFIYLSKLG